MNTFTIRERLCIAWLPVQWWWGDLLDFSGEPRVFDWGAARTAWMLALIGAPTWAMWRAMRKERKEKA